MCTIYVCACVRACRGQKRAADSLELKSKAVARHPTWVLGMELGSYERANTPNCWAIFLVPKGYFEDNKEHLTWVKGMDLNVVELLEAEPKDN